MLEYWSIEIVNGILFASVIHDNYFYGERNELFLFKQATLGM